MIIYNHNKEIIMQPYIKVPTPKSNTPKLDKELDKELIKLAKSGYIKKVLNELTQATGIPTKVVK